MGHLQLSSQALDLFLQPQAAICTLALLVAGQLLLQLLRLHGVCGGDCRQLLRQGLELFVLWRSNSGRGEEGSEVMWPRKTMKAILKRDFQGGMKSPNRCMLACFPGISLTKLYCIPRRNAGRQVTSRDDQGVFTGSGRAGSWLTAVSLLGLPGQISLVSKLCEQHSWLPGSAAFASQDSLLFHTGPPYSGTRWHKGLQPNLWL